MSSETSQLGLKRVFSETSDAATLELDSMSLNRFSRQNAALGVETTAKLTKMKVLIVGVRGVGVETAKNLALQGAGSITLLDNGVSCAKDIGGNFFLNAQDVAAQLTRAEAVAPKLRDLNPVCKIGVETSLSDTVVAMHSALVITDISAVGLTEMLRLNEFCRGNGIAFFKAFIGGVSASLFSDQGSSHVINDPNGERAVQKIITDITPVDGNKCLIRYETPEGQPADTITEGYYTVSDINGIDELNGKTFEVTHPYSDPVKTIRVDFDLSLVGSYVAGGHLLEKKIPLPHPMQSLRSKIQDMGSAFVQPPTAVMTDMINFGAELQQHVALVATLLFCSANNGAFPRRATTGASAAATVTAEQEQKDQDEVVRLAKLVTAAPTPAADTTSTDMDVSADTCSIHVSVDEGFELDETFIRRFAKYAGVELQPMAAFVGGVLAQEVVKCSGKFTPLPGFLHFSALEALPESTEGLDCDPRDHRYDDLAAVYGWKFVERLGALKYFMVGCGALGCEFMKNFALNGVCCGPEGMLYVTDADRIELSNLSRQFLFREHNVGQPKSRAAGQMATVMNETFKVESLELFVGGKTEDTFNDNFWMALDGVCNALDNMESRNYVDIQCVKYEKSLLESGTMGTSCNVDTICPFKTRTYRDGGQASQGGGIPMCTLRNFPHLTDHCIEWSRDQFELLFCKLSKLAMSYASDPLAFEEDKRSKAESELGTAIFEIRSIQSYFRAAASPSVGTAAQLAYDMFHFLFRDKLLDLQAAFPPDSRMNDKGVDKGPFWSEKKRYPKVAVFNPEDEAHWNYMMSATCMFAVSLGVLPAKQENDDSWLKDFRTSEWVAGLCEHLVVPPYINAPVTLENNATSSSSGESDKEAKIVILDGLFSDLRNTSLNVQLPSEDLTQEFEKDDDLNFHIAFITAAANLRCDNYSIKRTDFQACKIIAGKIIAAIATTTAAVCGLVVLELFKLMLDKPTEAYMNRQLGLAINAYTSFTQEPPVTYKTITESVQPGPEDELPADAFDESGKLKEEYVEKKVKRAYPEGHSVWDKLSGCTGDMTLKEFSEWFESEHKLKMLSWSFVLGSKKVTIDGESKVQQVSTPVYPPKPVLDPSLLPSLDLSMPQATTAIMRTAAAKPTQQYIMLWKQCKAAGKLPEAAEKAVDAITDNSTLREILQHMATLADQAETDKKIDTKAIGSLDSRRMWVIPASDTPLCRDIESGDDIENLAAIKITL